MTEQIDFLKRTAYLSQEISSTVLQEFCSELERLEHDFSSEDIFRTTQFIHQPGVRISLSNFLAYWQNNVPEISPRDLSWALRSASISGELLKKGQTLELVWTGPSPGPSTLRRTDQVLLDLIQSAKNSVIIVTFAAYNIPRIASALIDGAKRGVTITLILESPEESDGKITFGALQALGEAVAVQSEVYVWPRDQRKTDRDGHHGSLHAKCAVADLDSLLLSSANLTEFALDLNMEMGILIRGGKLPMQVNQHFRTLISHGVLRKIG